MALVVSSSCTFIFGRLLYVSNPNASGEKHFQSIDNRNKEIDTHRQLQNYMLGSNKLIEPLRGVGEKNELEVL